MDKDGVLHNGGDVWPMYAALSPLGPLPTISWEAVREGVDDYRYLLTLSKRIEQARRGRDDPAKLVAEEAAKAVETMMAKIRIDTERKRHREIGAAAVRASRSLRTADYDAFRRTVSEFIMRLQASAS